MKVGDLVAYVETLRAGRRVGGVSHEIVPGSLSGLIIDKGSSGATAGRFKIYWPSTNRTGWWDKIRLEVVNEGR